MKQFLVIAALVCFPTLSAWSRNVEVRFLAGKPLANADEAPAENVTIRRYRLKKTVDGLSPEAFLTVI